MNTLTRYSSRRFATDRCSSPFQTYAGVIPCSRPLAALIIRQESRPVTHLPETRTSFIYFSYVVCCQYKPRKLSTETPYLRDIGRTHGDLVFTGRGSRTGRCSTLTNPSSLWFMWLQCNNSLDESTGLENFSLGKCGIYEAMR